MRYLNLLRSVVNAARTSSFPRKDALDVVTLSNSAGADGENSFALGGVDKLTRDQMIGAAGELFLNIKGGSH
jgi:hypothetical protein